MRGKLPLFLLLVRAFVVHILASGPSAPGTPLLRGVSFTQEAPDQQPAQIHLAYGTADDSLVVSWSTAAPTAASCVLYWLASDTADTLLEICGHSTRFKDGGPVKYEQVLHRVLIQGLLPGQRYLYACGSPGQAWSAQRSFVAKRQAEQLELTPLKLLVFGDMGTLNSQVLPDLLADAAGTSYDAVLAVGDFAYDLRDDDGHRGDEYMSMIQPLAATMPFMTCPGNHEVHYNFSHYRHRFAMPNPLDSTASDLYYSWNLGPIHVISYNTEVFFFPDVYSHADMRRQYEWLEQDLAAANKQRDVRPWIVVMGHRPMYCTVAGPDGRCDGEHEASRLGIPSSCPESAHLCAATPAANEATYPVEELFHRHGVSLAVYGHVHDYEHFWPTFDRVAQPGHTGRGLHLNPGATVHVTTGAAGNDEMVVGPLPPPRGSCTASAPWCAFQSGYYPRNGQGADYSYSRVTVHNTTHLHWAQWSTTLQTVVDEFWIEQHHHGPFLMSIRGSTS